MKHGPPNDDKNNPKHHFQFGWDFVLDKSTGIYQPKTNECEAKCDERYNSVGWNTPFLIEIKRDKFAFILTFIASLVSAVTLGIVATYTYYAGGQWREMVR